MESLRERPANLVAARMRVILLAVSVLVLTLGAIEDVYGNTDSGDVYGSDAVQYLDIARAIGRHDWHSALNPLWSQGYPAMLAAVRPVFAEGPGGDWTATRVVNFGIFGCNYFAFLYLLAGLAVAFRFDGSEQERRRATVVWVGGLCVFLSTQICLGQVSRVNPDEVVTTCFFLGCGLLVRLLRPGANRGLKTGLLLGLVLGVGFIVKAIFLALGAAILLLLALALWKARRGFAPLIAAGAVFAVIAGSYGAALSHAMGRPTLGDSGSINYAWHVNRLQKWVHWEGGTQPASEAWPKPWIARFAQWDTNPPEFGEPIHPSKVLQRSPLIYGFSAPFHATYTPYYNPPYWYEGYRHLVRPRYQLIALAKSLGDLAVVLLKLPILFATLLAIFVLLRSSATRSEFRGWLARHWLVWGCGLLGVAIYLPVHLEGRYLAGFLAALMVCGVVAAATAADFGKLFVYRLALAMLGLGLAAELSVFQVPVWRNVLAHKSPAKNEEWQVGEAVLAQHLPPRSEVGVISWTANLHCDWAYIANLRITSEIQAKPDDDEFWRLSPKDQRETLATFRRAGAVAVFSRDRPPDANAPGWVRLGDTGMWMYRFE